MRIPEKPPMLGEEFLDQFNDPLREGSLGSFLE